MSQWVEFDRAMIEIVARERPRMDALERDLAAIKSRAATALALIEKAINEHPTTGGAKRLVRFLAGVSPNQRHQSLQHRRYMRRAMTLVNVTHGAMERGRTAKESSTCFF